MQFPKDLLIFAFPSIPGRRRHDECVCVVYRIEFVNDLSCLLNHRHLVLTGRDHVCLKCGDIGSLADRVGEETDRDARLEVSHLDLALYSWVSL